MRLRHQVETFASDLACFAMALPEGHARVSGGLVVLADRLPLLVEDDRFVVVGSALHESLALTATLLALARRCDAAPGRVVGHLERRVSRLFEVGSALEPTARRPQGRRRPMRRRLRRGSLAPAPVAAYGRG